MAINKPNYNLGLTLPNNDPEMENIGAQALLSNLLKLQTQPASPLGQAQPGQSQAPGVPSAQPEPMRQFGLPSPGPFDPSKYPELPSFTPFSQTDQGRKVIDELSQRRQQAVDKQQEEMNAAKIQLQDYLTKEKAMDLLPIAALVDTWTGSNMAKYFKDEQDKNKELAFGLQQELLKYGQAGVGSETQALQDRLQLGAEETKQLQQLTQNKYEADLRAKAALDNAQLDAATRLRAAEEARKAARDLEEYRWKMRKEIEAMKQKGRQSQDEKYNRTEARQTAFKISDNPVYRTGSSRLKLLGILDDYENALRGSDLSIMPSSKKTQLEGIYQRFVSAQKEADELGALTGSDLKIVWGQVPDATSLKYALESKFGGPGKQGILDSIKRAKEAIARDHDIAVGQLKNVYSGFGADDVIEKFDKSFKTKYTGQYIPKASDLPTVGKQQEVTPVKPKTLEEKEAYLKSLKEKAGRP